jgi:hypothetical protein
VVDGALAGLSNLGNVGTGNPLTAQPTVAIAVLSAAQQTANPRSQVKALQTQKVLTADQASVLLDKFALKGNSGEAGKVGAFVNGAFALRKSGVLTQDLADALIFWANIMLSSITNSDR